MAKPISYRSPEAVAAVEAETGRTGNDYRALVCVFLFGGNDSHNMIIPRDGSANRIHYDLQRGTLAITAGTELPLTAEWGVHPSMTNVKSIFDAGKLGVLMNVGLLAQPTTRAQYKANTVTLPTQLYAHNSQQALWQALPILAKNPVNGYMGRADDLVGEFFNFSAVDDIGGQFSIAGRPLQMQGYESRSNDLNTSGPTSATASATNAPGTYLTPARTRQVWDNERQALFAGAVGSSVKKQAAITTNLQALPAPVTTTFTGLSTAYGNLGGQLAMVARVLLSRSNMGHRRDTFFVSISGWDDHDGLAANYGPRLAALDAALGAFWAALGQLGLQENVALYTQSDFGRALKQNNDGSDHGWGGHALVMGGSVLGGQLFGTPPDFATNSVNDADQGRLIPTTSADQYVATMLKWWGVPESQMELVLPNLANFSQKTLPMLREPLPVVTQPKAYSIDLVSQVLNTGAFGDDVSFTLPYTAVTTQFDREGNLIASPVNVIPNSEFFGGEALVGQSSPPLGNHWLDWNTTPGNAGLKFTLNEIGVENGMRYTEWNLSGTVTVTAAYSQIAFGASATVPTAIVAANGQSYTFFLKARRILSKSPNPVSWGCNLRATTAGGSSVTSHDLTAAFTLSPTFGAAVADKPYQMSQAINITDATAGRLIPRLMIPGLAVGTVINDTIRVYEPMIVPGIWERPPKYIPTYGTQRVLPRLDYDPTNGRVRGIVRDPARVNIIRNGMGFGGSPGVPGTLPTNWNRDLPAGVSSAIGLTKVSKNMRVIPIRFFGRAASGSINLSFEQITQNVVVTNEDWVGSVFARLAGGSLKNVSIANIEYIMYNTGTYVDAAANSIATIDDKPISAQRWFIGKQVTNATVNQGRLQLRFTPVANEYIDFTIEVAVAQLEKGRQASNPIPTGVTANAANGAPGQRSIDALEVVTGFSGWFNPAEGSVVVKGETQVSKGGARNSWPRLVAFADGPTTASLQNNFGIYALTSPDPAFHGRSGSAAAVANVATGDNSISTPVIADGKPATRVMSYSAGYLQTAHRGVLSTAVVPTGFPTVNRLQLGAPPTDSTSWIQSVDYYSTKLTTVEMAALTAS